MLYAWQARTLQTELQPCPVLTLFWPPISLCIHQLWTWGGDVCSSSPGSCEQSYKKAGVQMSSGWDCWTLRYFRFSLLTGTPYCFPHRTLVLNKEKEGSLEEADKRPNIQEDVGCLRDVSMWPVKRNLGWRENGLSTVLSHSGPSSPVPQLSSQPG